MMHARKNTFRGLAAGRMPAFGMALLALILVFCSPALAAKDKILDVQTIKTKSGIEAWIVEDKTVPVISMSFSFEGGLAHDPLDKPGVARLVSILLDEGAGDLKSQDFQKQLSDNAISLSFTPGRDAFYGRLKTLKKNKDLAFDLLRLALSSPRFDEDAVTRMKNANESKIKDDLGDPSWLSARTFNGMLFEGHYYARPGYGHLDSMAKITRQDLFDFTRAQFARDVLKVAIAGDITKEEAEAAIDAAFGKLPEKAEEAAASSEAKLAYGGKTILLPLDTPQTYIAVGQAGLYHTDPDWHAAIVMNHILGGDGEARLMTEIREKKGLTYGVYSSLNSMKHAALIQSSLSASNEKVEEALSILRAEWKKMAEKGATQKETDDAKSYLTGSLLLQLTSTDDISGTLNSIQRDGLGPDYINQRNAAISAVTPDDIRRVAKKILEPEKLSVVLVGQPKNIDVDILLDKPPGMKDPAKQ